MLRGINKSTIFHDQIDYMKMAKILATVSSPTEKDGETIAQGCAIYAYCLMPNHIHLLMSEVGETLNKTMKRLGVAYVSYYNKRYERVGHLFQDRFKSEPVGDSTYFANVLRYIHFNPVEARMTKLPGHYKWSSWHEFEKPSADGRDIIEHSVPFGNANWQELRELILKNIEPDDLVNELEIERAKNLDESKQKLISLLPEGIQISDLTDMPKSDRNAIIIKAIKSGVNQQHLARLIRLNRTTIQRIWHSSIKKCNIGDGSF